MNDSTATIESGPRKLAFVAPRYAPSGTVGGAETLLRRLAESAAASGRDVDFLTTCAEDHFTWENSREPGSEEEGGLTVRYFPVDEDRDIGRFLRIQESISNDGFFSEEDEEVWMRNNVNSRALNEYLTQHGDDYECLVMGPYLFGVIFYASLIHPNKTLLVPCLHDEPFAYLRIMHRMFESVRGFLFNSDPEAELARGIFDIAAKEQHVVGMGLEPFEADPHVFAGLHGIEAPYLLYSGRREALKGTPLLCDYVDAFRKRTERDIKLVFTGKGPIEAPSDLEPHIVDVGFVSEAEKREAMAGALAFVHPSVNESFGIVLLESWLARTPALVHGRSAVLRWQCEEGGGGLWFDTYPEFEEELLLLLDRPALRDALGERGRRYVLDRYSPPSVRERLLKALESVGGEGR